MTKKQEIEVQKIALAYIEASKRMDEAEKEKKALQQSLLLLIPAEETMFGVRHVKESKGQPAWKQIAEETAKRLLPKSKLPLFEVIKTECTGKPREYIKRNGEL